MNPPPAFASKPDSFVAYLEPAGQARPHDWPVPPLASHLTVETADTAVTLYFSDASMLTTSADGQRLLLLTGDLCQPQAADVGAALLGRYDQRGLDFVADLNGTFRLLLIDRPAGIVAFATDRMNSNKLLAGSVDGVLIVSTSLYFHPVRGARIDRTAVAEYLATSYFFNDRTLYEHVKMLDSGSIYRLEAGRLTQRRYWRFEHPAPTSASPEALKKDLGDLIVEATRRRVRSDRPLYLSLSGGYDSSTIAAVLSTVLHVDDVRCFTYAHGESQPENEEAVVAAQISAFCGYPHQTVPAFDGDIVRMLRRNALLGGGITRPCDEIDAWVRLGQQIGSGPRPVLFTGDTLFLETDWQFKSRRDMTAGARLYDFSVLAWLEPLIGTGVYREFVAATQAEIERAVERVPGLQPGEDALNWRDRVRFDQIDSRMTVIWREYFAGHFFRPAHPLLDNDVLDFLLRLPSSLRRGKRLYLATVTAMFPTLYATPRAAFTSYATYWPAALAQQTTAIQALVREQSSPLDDVIAPDLLLTLLAGDRAALTRSSARREAFFRRVYRLLRRAGLHRSALGRPSRYAPIVDANNFLKRALTLRGFLAEMQAHNGNAPPRNA